MTRPPSSPPSPARLEADLARFRELWDGEVDEATRGLPPESVERFAGFVVGQQVAVPLALRLGEATERLPAVFAERLRRRATLQRERTAGLISLHDRVGAGLAARGVRTLMLKGPPLARRLHGALDGRESVDLDLLVRPRDGERARRALAELGFRRRSRALFGVATTTRFVHALDFVASDGLVDLHSAIDRHPSLRLDPEAPWRGTRREPLGVESVELPGEEIEALAIGLGVVRDGERGRLKLKHLLDLRLALGGPDAAERALFAARAQRAGRPLARALALAAAALGTPAAAAAVWRSAIDRHGGDATARAELPALLAGAPSRRSRRWSFSSWEAPFAACAAWWLLSLPFRIAVHGRRSARLARSRSAAARGSDSDEYRPKP